MRAQTHNVRNTRFIMKQKKQYMKKHKSIQDLKHNKENKLEGHLSGRPLNTGEHKTCKNNTRKHKLGGYPSGRLPLWQATPLIG